MTTCRDEVLDVARTLAARSVDGTFTLDGILREMRRRGSCFKESTIRTHVTSRMCANAPDHHGTCYDDLWRVERGTYRLHAQTQPPHAGPAARTGATASAAEKLPTRPHLSHARRAGAFAVSERIGLVGCVKTKLPHAAKAADLYTSELFLRRRAYVERHCDRWFILSAKHGLLDPEQEVEPYEQALKDVSTHEKQAWSHGVMSQLYGRFPSLRGLTFEVHAGRDYFGFGLRDALIAAGARVEAPTEHLRQGEQLQFYKRALAIDEEHAVASAAALSAERAGHSAGVARELTGAFVRGEIDLSQRTERAVVGRQGVPEMPAADRIRGAGASEAEVRLFLTLTCAMDRARDASRLWSAATSLYLTTREAFDPAYIQGHADVVAAALRTHGVSQRHGPDLDAWRTIADSLRSAPVAPEVHGTVFDGEGDASVLLRKLQGSSSLGTALFPMLKGPKVGPMWIRMMAYPGGAQITHLAVIPVAVDTHVRRASEALGVADTQGLDLETARGIIQQAWKVDVAGGGADGPPGLENTCAALDPALWFFGKYGCSHCASLGSLQPVTTVCSRCQLSLTR